MGLKLARCEGADLVKAYGEAVAVHDALGEVLDEHKERFRLAAVGMNDGKKTSRKTAAAGSSDPSH